MLLTIHFTIIFFFFFFNDTATTEIYTLSLHDALPICGDAQIRRGPLPAAGPAAPRHPHRSEEHTSELQSPCNLVCRLLLEKKKNKKQHNLYSSPCTPLTNNPLRYVIPTSIGHVRLLV